MPLLSEQHFCQLDCPDCLMRFWTWVVAWQANPAADRIVG